MHDSVDPDARAILAHMPAAIRSGTVASSDRHLLFLGFIGAIFRREDYFAGLPEGFFCSPAEHPLRALAPVDNVIARIHQEHRVFRRAFDEEPQFLFAFAQQLRAFLLVGYILCHARDADDVALFVADRKTGVANPALLAIARPNDAVIARESFTSKCPRQSSCDFFAILGHDQIESLVCGRA